MNEYVSNWHTWLHWLDGQVPDTLLAGVSVALLSTVVLSKLLLLLVWRFRPSFWLAVADFCVLAWACSRISSKLILFKTTPEHVFLHFALAVYAINSLVQMVDWWRNDRVAGMVELLR